MKNTYNYNRHRKPVNTGNANNSNKKGTEKKRVKSTKTKVINTIIYTIASALLIFAGWLLFNEFYVRPDTEFVDLSDANVELPTLEPLGTPVSQYDKIPVLISFVRQKLSCAISPVGIGEDGVMETKDSATLVAWLSVHPYVIPGDVGNAVLAGHNLWKGRAGTFSILKQLQKGDAVYVLFDDQSIRYFEVADVYVSGYDDGTPMKSSVDEPTLTLITCNGDWDSSLGMSRHRVVVTCKLVGG